MAFSWNPFNRNNYDNHSSDIETQKQKNPNAEAFSKVGNDIDFAVSQRSVVSKQNTNSFIANPLFQSITNAMSVMPILNDKTERIKEYRTISLFPECDWCLDEICDDFVHTDENGNFINIKFSKREDLNPIQQDIIESEFTKFVDLFNIRDEGFNLIKRFLIEGELAFENIINSEKPELGIIGVKFLPAEYYQTLINTRTGRSVGIYFDTVKLADDIRTVLSNSYIGAQQVFNSTLVSSSASFNKDNCIIMLWPQVTYINSGEISPDGLIAYSMLEKCKQAYHQLSLLQDAAVILRVTRAPERLLFNVSTGKMTQNYADEYVRRFANGLKSKKVSAGNRSDANGSPDIASVYNPISMLESFVFGKSDANEGTTVESVGSSASYEEIGDIEYFLRRLMKQFKVPFSRYKVPENIAERDETISYEEYAFTRMIIRFQSRFAIGIKRSFITHLKLRGIWDNYNLKDSDIQIIFNQPVLYDLYQTQKLVTAKMDTYGAIADKSELSKIVAMKKILGYSDSDVEENYKNLIKEGQMVALSEFYAEKLKEEGPTVFNPPIKIKGHDVSLPADTKAEGDGDGDVGLDDEEKEDDSGVSSETPADDSPSEEPPPPTFGLA